METGDPGNQKCCWGRVKLCSPWSTKGPGLPRMTELAQLQFVPQLSKAEPMLLVVEAPYVWLLSVSLFIGV